MKTPWLLIIFCAAFLAALVAAWPMRAALAAAEADRIGLAARDVSGSLWSGRLQQATLGPVELGDVRARLALFPLFVGAADVAIAAEDGPLRLRLRRDGRRLSVRQAVMTAPLSVLGLPGAAAGQVSLIEAEAVFDGDRCTAGSGRVQLNGLAGSGWTAPPLTGALACRAGVLTASLTGADAVVEIEAAMIVQRTGRWALDLTARSADPVVIAALTAQGFRPGPNGLVLELTGRIAA